MARRQGPWPATIRASHPRCSTPGAQVGAPEPIKVTLTPEDMEKALDALGRGNLTLALQIAHRLRRILGRVRLGARGWRHDGPQRLDRRPNRLQVVLALGGRERPPDRGWW